MISFGSIVAGWLLICLFMYTLTYFVVSWFYGFAAFVFRVPGVSVLVVFADFGFGVLV